MDGGSSFSSFLPSYMAVRERNSHLSLCPIFRDQLNFHSRRNWLHLGSKEAGPKIAAIFSIVESCRKLNLPVRQCLADVLPGLADRAIQSLAELRLSRSARRSLTLRPAYSPSHRMTFYTGGSSRFVTFTAAPIATGWSESCRVGLAPAEKPCLGTAHKK